MVTYFCVFADNDFLNDLHSLIESSIPLMLISLYIVYASTMALHASNILGVHKKLSSSQNMVVLNQDLDIY